jgi:hypothetical protein
MPGLACEDGVKWTLTYLFNHHLHLIVTDGCLSGSSTITKIHYLRLKIWRTCLL